MATHVHKLNKVRRHVETLYDLFIHKYGRYLTIIITLIVIVATVVTIGERFEAVVPRVRVIVVGGAPHLDVDFLLFIALVTGHDHRHEAIRSHPAAQ